jgi:hypothetical protein
MWNPMEFRDCVQRHMLRLDSSWRIHDRAARLEHLSDENADVGVVDLPLPIRALPSRIAEASCPIGR